MSNHYIPNDYHVDPSARATIGRRTTTDWMVVSLQGDLTLWSRTKTVTLHLRSRRSPLYNRATHHQPAAPMSSLDLSAFQLHTFTLSRQHMTLSFGVWASFASVIPDICHLHRLRPPFLFVSPRCEAVNYRWTRGHTAGRKLVATQQAREIYI